MKIRIFDCSLSTKHLLEGQIENCLEELYKNFPKPRILDRKQSISSSDRVIISIWYTER